MKNEIYRHRESRLPIVCGRDGFTTDIILKEDAHHADGRGD
jgi:hypothetical protein